MQLANGLRDKWKTPEKGTVEIKLTDKQPRSELFFVSNSLSSVLLYCMLWVSSFNLDSKLLLWNTCATDSYAPIRYDSPMEPITVHTWDVQGDGCGHMCVCVCARLYMCRSKSMTFICTITVSQEKVDIQLNVWECKADARKSMWLSGGVGILKLKALMDILGSRTQGEWKWSGKRYSD